MTAESVHLPTHRRTRTPFPLLGAAVFLLAYLAVSPVTDRIAALPMPDAPTAEVYAYFTDHGAASIVTGLLQLVSVAGFALFLCSALQHEVPSPHRFAARIIGWVAAVAMVVSSAIAIALPLFAEALSPAAVELGREISFFAGGVVHVLALGGLTLTIGLWAAWSRPVRVMAWIAAVPALASAASLVWYYTSILLPAGRLLTMLALVVAGISLVRGRSLGDGDDSLR
ncbi:hypothetical protein [Brevibacterium oceani]|uniref:hypothetical protein n=1 Tax=Brevibacterium oceani TaxID=358099 RepID=UPI0015E7DF2A|nr:hypothetical protein [Brevibacterium oceani]